MFSKDGCKHTNRHALLSAQYFCAETLGLHQGLHLISNNVVNRPTVLPLQIVLAMHDINPQTHKGLRGGRLQVRRLVPTSSLPLGKRLLRTAAALRAAATTTTTTTTAAHGRDLRRERGELVDEVLGAEVAVELLVWSAGRPGTFYEDGGERAGYFGRCCAPDGDRLRVGRETVRGDVAEEEEFLA